MTTPLSPTLDLSTMRRVDRTGAALAGAAVLAAVLEALQATALILTRPPCPPHYVRLIDFAPIGVGWAVITGLPSIALLVAACRARWGSRVWPRRTGAILFLLLPLPMNLLLGLEMLSTVGAEYDPGCWTF